MCSSSAGWLPERAKSIAVAASSPASANWCTAVIARICPKGACSWPRRLNLLGICGCACLEVGVEQLRQRRGVEGAAKDQGAAIACAQGSRISPGCDQRGIELAAFQRLDEGPVGAR